MTPGPARTAARIAELVRLHAEVAKSTAERTQGGRPPGYRRKTTKTVVRDERGRIKEVLEATEWVPPTT